MQLLMSGLEPLWPHLLAGKYWRWLLEGWCTTVLASLLVMVASTVLGIGFAVARSAALAPLRWLALGYLSVFRNTPLLVQLFFWYFGVPSLLPRNVDLLYALLHPTGRGVLDELARDAYFEPAVKPLLSVSNRSNRA
jgi:His/Glu/Gln/Arg/opine family amino acid ABC transporter permease subunit